jgi:hypothetical protein
MQINLDPDEIEGKVLTKPNVYNAYGEVVPADVNILRTIVTEPVAFKRWAIFCLEYDTENAKYLQDKFYGLSESKHLGIYVEYCDVITLQKYAKIKDFQDAMDDYYYANVAPAGAAAKKAPVAKGAKPPTEDKYFFCVIIPGNIPNDMFYKQLKSKINKDNSVISQFVQSKTIARDKDAIFMNILRQINTKMGGDLWRMAHGPEIS